MSILPDVGNSHVFVLSILCRVHSSLKYSPLASFGLSSSLGSLKKHLASFMRSIIGSLGTNRPLFGCSVTRFCSRLKALNLSSCLSFLKPSFSRSLLCRRLRLLFTSRKFSSSSWFLGSFKPSLVATLSLIAAAPIKAAMEKLEGNT